MPARLVLETDGDKEEVCLWFRPTVNKTEVATHAPMLGKRRRERARRRRRREERRREADQIRHPSDMPTIGVATVAATVQSASPQEESLSPGTDLPPTKPTLPSSPSSTARAHVYKARLLALKRTKAALTTTRASQRSAALSRREVRRKALPGTRVPVIIQYVKGWP